MTSPRLTGSLDPVGPARYARRMRRLSPVRSAALPLALTLALSASAACAFAQTSEDPFPTPISATADVVRVGLTDFATLPDVGGQPVRMMLLADEPGTKRLFVNDMRGGLFGVSYDGKTVAPYLDINADRWNVRVQSQGNERGFQSFAFHPQFAQRGAAGFGKFYTWSDVSRMDPAPDYTFTGEGTPTHDTVLLEWTAKDPSAAAYDGDAPREMLRLRQPFQNHNGGHLTFNLLARPGTPDYGLLYLGIADGGSGGDPMRMSQNLATPFGKVFRIDPLGKNGPGGKYGIPASNPFVSDNDPKTLGEIYASGVRNPQRFGWDSKTNNLYVADIGQNIIEEISLVPRGGNLGWNEWEASYKFIDRTHLDMTKRRGDPKMTFPMVEFDHKDALFPIGRVAVTGVVVSRGTKIPQLANLLIFGDNPSGEVFYVSADLPHLGGQDPIRRILFTRPGQTQGVKFLDVIQEKNAAQGRSKAARADLRFGTGPNGQIFLLNKQDGVIRLLTR